MATTNADTASETIFDAVGGLDGVRALVDRFYDLMDAEGEYAGIRALHPPTLDGSREKLFLFLTGWMGGPPLYIQKYGHPRLRARHLPFPIGVSERDQWLSCMQRAMVESTVPAKTQAFLYERLSQVADFMRNQDS